MNDLLAFPARSFPVSLILMAMLMLSGCGDPCTGGIGYVVDADGDGFSCDDCDDDDKSVYPGADEICDEKDQDCDQSVDEDPAIAPAWYSDQDGDLHGDIAQADAPFYACSAPSDMATVADDCNDSSAEIFPGAIETCNHQDDDCDDLIDEGLLISLYPDEDGDGHGRHGSPTDGCQGDVGFATGSADCDDTRASVYPGALELCNQVDDDCDEAVDEDFDDDQDGHLESMACGEIGGDDCADTDPSVYPGAQEQCNSRDDDCDSLKDEDFDDDGDGHLDATACSAIGGDDCLDSDDLIYPGAAELCDATDNDCDTQIDEDFDLDGDGFSACSGDCNDENPDINPGAQEICDAEDVDEDCDSLADDEDDSVAPEGQNTYYPDADGDGYGVQPGLLSCETQSVGYSLLSGDCNDASGDVHPDAVESCNPAGIDEDCDLLIDDADVNVSDTLTFFVDNDGDGYGGNDLVLACQGPPPGSSAESDDCDDANGSVHPGALEFEDGMDNNCNGRIDACTDLDCDDRPDIIFTQNENLDSYVAWAIPSGNVECPRACSGADCSWYYSTCALTDLQTKAGTSSALGDLDLDGFLEVVIAHYTVEDSDNSVYIFQNSCAGAYQAGVTHESCTRTFSRSERLIFYSNVLGNRGTPMNVQIADMDGNGWPDLVVLASHSGGSRLWIVWGSEADSTDVLAGFANAARTELSTGEGRLGIVPLIADFNNDALPDIFITDQGESYLYWNGGNRSFAEILSLTVAGALFSSAAFDVDRDNDLDIVVPTACSNNSWILVNQLGEESSVFPSFDAVPGPPTGIDANSSLDIVPPIPGSSTFSAGGIALVPASGCYAEGTSDAGTVNLMLVPGASSLTRVNLRGSSSFPASVGDFNGDGKVDLLTGPYVYLYSSGTFGPSQSSVLESNQTIITNISGITSRVGEPGK